MDTPCKATQAVSSMSCLVRCDLSSSRSIEIESMCSTRSECFAVPPEPFTAIPQRACVSLVMLDAAADRSSDYDLWILHALASWATLPIVAIQQACAAATRAGSKPTAEELATLVSRLKRLRQAAVESADSWLLRAQSTAGSEFVFSLFSADSMDKLIEQFYPLIPVSFSGRIARLFSACCMPAISAT